MKSPNPAIPASTEKSAPPTLPQPARARAQDPVAAKKNGFDPYNSGVFDRRDTWSKVLRK